VWDARASNVALETAAGDAAATDAAFARAAHVVTLVLLVPGRSRHIVGLGRFRSGIRDLGSNNPYPGRRYPHVPLGRNRPFELLLSI
jgi:hypothetical protein